MALPRVAALETCTFLHLPPLAMSTDTSKLRNKIAKLNKSLDELESKLEPLFAQSLDETLLGLDTIQQAKLLVIIPYVVYDLVFGKLDPVGPFFPVSIPLLRDTNRVCHGHAL